MSKFTNFLKRAGSFLAGASAMVAGSVQAAIDTAGVTTAIGVAEASAHSVGTVVIGVIAGLAVIGIVIALVKKL